MNVHSPESKPVKRHIERSASPPRRGGGYSINYWEDNGEASPIKKVLNLSREPYYSAAGQPFNTINNENKPILSVKRRSNNIRNINRKNLRNQYNDGEDNDYYYNQPPYYNVMNPEESQNDYKFSSIQDDERFANGLKYSRSPNLLDQITNLAKLKEILDIMNQELKIVKLCLKLENQIIYVMI